MIPRQSLCINLPPVTELETLSGLGISAAYIVGGTVRDMLLGRKPQDFDLVVPSDPQHFASVLSQKTGGRLVVIGRANQTLHRVVTPTRIYDVTQLQGSSIVDDLKKRDFTINAMAFDVMGRKLIDCLNGREDLATRTIRLTSTDALCNDPVRLIRAYRLAAELNHTLAPATLEAIEKAAHRITLTAGERIRDELLKILDMPSATETLVGMNASGLMMHIFPELAHFVPSFSGQNRYYTFEAEIRPGLNRVEVLLNEVLDESIDPEQTTMSHQMGMPPATVKLGVLLHGIGQMNSTSRHGVEKQLPGHARRGAMRVAGISERLRLSKRQAADLTYLVGHQRKPAALYRLYRNQRFSRLAAVRFLLNHGRKSVALLTLARAVGCSPKTDKSTSTAEFDTFAAVLINTFLGELLPGQKHPPLVDGNDLIRRFGLNPGPLFRRMLKMVRERQLSGELETRPDALKWLACRFNLHRTDRTEG